MLRAKLSGFRDRGGAIAVRYAPSIARETVLVDTNADLKKLPLDAWHRRMGARMVPFAGYEMPIQYDGIMAEHLWTREHAGLFDVSHMGQLTLKGEGVVEALEALLPADIASLKPGRVRYSLLLDDDGGILDDLMVTNITPWIEADEEAGTEGHWGETEFALVVNGASKHDDIAFIESRLPDGVTLTHHEDMALLAVQGPRASNAMERTFRGLTESIHFMQFTRWQFGELPLMVWRSGYTGEDGFEIAVPTHQAETLAGRLCAEIEIKPVGLGARDSLRLEAGLPLYGHDLSTETDPVSAGLGFALSKKRRESGGFTGADTVMGHLADGTPTLRIGLALDGKMAAREGAEVFAGEDKVGTVTSGGFAPSLGHPVAMAYVDTAHAADGTQLEIAVRNKRLPARVVPMPFVPHRYARKGAA